MTKPKQNNQFPLIICSPFIVLAGSKGEADAQ